MRYAIILLPTLLMAAPAEAQTGPQPQTIDFGHVQYRIFNQSQGVHSIVEIERVCRTGHGRGVGDSMGSESTKVLSSVQCGALSLAAGENATAIGASSFAVEGGTALGNSAFANGINSTALGRGASAAFENSTAVGAGATATAANQVTLGATGSSVRVGDIAASTAAQDPGSVGVATVDANGTLGRNTTIIPAIQALQGSSGTRITALEAAQASLSGGVDRLFDLRELDRRDMREGVAVATAMGRAHFPSAPGRTSYDFGLATFRGEQALGGSIMHRLPTNQPFAISAGFSYAGNKNNALRVGVAGEF